MIIHNPSTVAFGDSEEMLRAKAITEAMFKDTKRNIQSEKTEKEASIWFIHFSME